MTSHEIKQKALSIGYLTCGIIEAVAYDEYTQHIGERIKSFPDSRDLYERFQSVAKPQENGKSIIVCTRAFNNYKTSESLSGIIGKVYQFDRRVPYSQAHRAKLEFDSYLNTLGLNILEGYVPSRWAAAKAGVGKFGRNNFIYDPDNGSNIWIDTWIVDKELEYEAPPVDTFLPACNDGCNKCIEACPTKALCGKLSMDMGRCITHIQFSPERIRKEETRSQMGTWVYGCDVCQDVCPMNKDKFTGSEAFPLLLEHEQFLQLEKILEMDEETYLNVVNPRFWYSGEEGLWLWKCNALRSMINSGDSKYHRLIIQYCDDPDERIGEVAKWGCDRLGL